MRAAARAVRRCPLGLSVVVEVPPVLPSGEPFPTRFWLSCPLAHRRIARLEAAGGVRDADAKVRADPEFRARLAKAHVDYARARDARVPSRAGARRPTGGVAGIAGGVEGGVKCLHAHYAHYAAGGDNPVGEAVAAEIEPLDCAAPCVIAEAPADPAAAGADDAAHWRRNPAWREPRPPHCPED